MTRARRLVLCVALVLTSPLAARAVVINEVMPDPGGIDWNGDGIVGPAAADEFVEIVNPAESFADISGWRIINGPNPVHIFADPTILPAGASIVVFGYPPGAGIPGLAFAASGGGLDLANSSEQITLDDGAVAVDTISYNVSYMGVSWNRNPDGGSAQQGIFSRHDALPDSIGGGSPGRHANGDSLLVADPTPLPFINEWLPNPNTVVSDWNGDGLGDDAHDEFVEIVNPAAVPRDLGGWTIADGFGVRHIFEAGTVLPADASIVVIANGTPIGIPGLAVASSSGQLGFNNGAGDTITLKNGAIVASKVAYAQDTADVSWNRSPDADPTTTNFALHSSIAPGDLLSSPGRRTDGTPFPTPEPGGAALFAFAALGWLTRSSRLRSLESHG